MEQRKEIKFLSNIAVEIELGEIKGPYTNKDHPEWGQSWLVLCKDSGGSLSKFYAKQALYDKFTGFLKGDRLRIIYAEEKNEKGTYHQWKVFPALFEPDGEKTPERKPSIADDSDAYEIFREKRLRVFKDALEDAIAVCQVFKQGGIEYTSQDIEKIAVSMVMDFQKSK
jgi:hypothetical protein